MDLALLMLRLVVGGLVTAHGLGKLGGWFKAGYGLKGTAGYLEGFGFRPGMFWAVVVGLTETLGGLALAAGLITPLAGATIAGTMFVAARTDHGGKGPWIFNGGWEHVLTNAAAALAVVGTGPGRYSLDRALGWDLAGAGYFWAALALALLTAAATLVLRGVLVRDDRSQPSRSGRGGAIRSN
ncbi:MAG TPA: DoxX family protein [Actinomycetes bacterium]|nr:DoxX family protein [Actinomycetes bacterium]